MNFVLQINLSLAHTKILKIVDSIYNKSNSIFLGLNCYSYNLNKFELSAKSELGDYNKNIFGIIKKDFFQNEQLYFLPDVKYVKRSDYHNPIRSKNFKFVIKKINNINKIDIYLQTIKLYIKILLVLVLLIMN